MSGGKRRERGTSGAPQPASDSGGRLPWILLGVVVVASAILVAGAFVPAPHTGGDNAAYLTLAYSLLQGGYTELFDPAGPPHTKYRPVFPGILALLMLLGFRTWTAFKAVAVVSTVGGVALTYLWARRRLGPVWAAGVALLVAASAAVVYYSHWILSDPTFAAFTFLSLWALERADDEGAPAGWLALGVAAAGLAYFTRSAGLPLVVALAGWLLLRRRWRTLVATAVALGLPMALWLLRARGSGQGEYVSEFWLVDPYDPGQGTVGVAGLAGREGTKLVGYLGTHIPGGLIGAGAPGLPLLGVVLVAAAVAGWGLAVRKRVGPAEIFFPLYAGLILLWPAVWSGDRFALPLFPLLFLYAASALRHFAGQRGPRAVTAAGALAFLAVLLPATGAWVRATADASACSAAVRRAGPFACYGPGVMAFVDAAGWAGANLPEGSAVLTRKPRMFYVLSGIPSRTFPFTENVDDHLALADQVGARYELFDQWDGLAGRYVAGAVGARPRAFCAARSFGDGGTVLLGILPRGERGDGTAVPGDEVRVAPCGAAFGGGGEEGGYASSSSRIPLLDRLAP